MRAEPAVERRHLELGGHRLSWLQSGDAAGPVALFLHGIPASAELWREVMPKVAAAGYCCLAPDLPGYGETRLAPRGDYSLTGSAALLLEWLHQRNTQGVWLIAHDIGGGVAQLMLTRDENLFAQATLSNCITADSWPVMGIRAMIWLAKMRLFAPLAALGWIPNALVSHELRRAVSDSNTLSQERMSRIFWDGKVSSAAGRQEFQRMLQALDPMETVANMAALRQVTVPVHLLWGGNDPFQPWQGPGVMLEASLQRVTSRKLLPAGHFVQIDNPEDYAACLLAEAPGARQDAPAQPMQALDRGEQRSFAIGSL